jgi:GNAT superfamily N-acetyltransferase
VIVRAARPEDRPLVGRMIGEFMDYLDAIEPFERPAGLIDTLLDQGFGPDPVCSTLIAERDGKAIGYLAWHLGVWEIFRSLHVISLFVRDEARGSGAGRVLMDAAKDIARHHRATRLVWEVWNRNPGAVAFYRSIGGAVYDDNLRMSLVVD